MTVLIEQIGSVIQIGGLYNKKVRQIKGVLSKIRDDFGSLSLARLNQFGNEEAIWYLITQPRISGKTARCILMYCFDRQLFPVDTHVWRVSRRLGLTPSAPKPNERQQCELKEKIPETFAMTSTSTWFRMGG